MAPLSEKGFVHFRSSNKELWRRFKRYCTLHGMKLGETMDQLLATFLDKAEPDTALIERQAQRETYLKSFDMSIKLRKRIGDSYQTFSKAYVELGGKEDYSNLREVTPKLAARFLNSNLGHQYILFEYYLEQRQKMYQTVESLYSPNAPRIPE